MQHLLLPLPVLVLATAHLAHDTRVHVSIAESSIELPLVSYHAVLLGCLVGATQSCMADSHTSLQRGTQVRRHWEVLLRLLDERTRLLLVGHGRHALRLGQCRFGLRHRSSDLRLVCGAQL